MVRNKEMGFKKVTSEFASLKLQHLVEVNKKKLKRYLLGRISVK